MRHAKANQLLSAYLERDLGETERAAVEVHLAGCVTCRADLEGLRTAVALLRRLPAPDSPPFLASRVMARIRDGEGRPAGWREWLAKLAVPAVAAPAAAVIAAAAVVFLAEPGNEVPRGDDTQQIAKRLPIEARAVGDVEPEALNPKRPPTAPQAPVARRERVPIPKRSPAAAQAPVLARRLRGAGHPHSTSLAAHFEGPAEAVLVSWQPQ